VSRTGPGPDAAPAAAVRECSKHYHRDQASARLALKRVLKKGKTRGKSPRRVYPCDVCDGWHLTSKKLSGKTPPWDTDPNWTRLSSRPGGRVTRKALS